MHGFGAQSLYALLAHIFESIEEAVVVTDGDDRVMLANSAALREFRYPEDVFSSLAGADLLAEPAARARDSAQPEEDAELDGWANDGHVNDGEAGEWFSVDGAAAPASDSRLMRYRRSDDSEFEGDTVSGPISDLASGSTLYLSIIRDVTDRRSSEQALHQLHGITADPALRPGNRRQAILALGRSHFGMPTGFIGETRGDRYRLLEAIDPRERLIAGDSHERLDSILHAPENVAAPFGVCAADTPSSSDGAFGFESYLGCPIRVEGRFFGTLCFGSPMPTGRFSQKDLDLVGMFAQWVGHELGTERNLAALEQAHARLSRVAMLDELTGLSNRRHLRSQLDRELQRAARTGKPLSVALIDLDHFKRVNDRYGHDAGDTALRHVGQVAGDLLRSTDVLGRWGGEEFLLLLPDNDTASGKAVAQRLIDRLAATPLAYDRAEIGLSASVGLVATHGDEKRDAVVRRADRAMYQAKAAGRGRVEVAA